LLKYLFANFYSDYFSKVPKGTNGGVSFAGLLVSFGGGLAVGLGYYLGVIIGGSAHLDNAPNQLFLILLGGVAGLIGSLIDSMLGATVQVRIVKTWKFDN